MFLSEYRVKMKNRKQNFKRTWEKDFRGKIRGNRAKVVKFLETNLVQFVNASGLNEESREDRRQEWLGCVKSAIEEYKDINAIPQELIDLLNAAQAEELLTTWGLEEVNMIMNKKEPLNLNLILIPNFS